MNIKIIRNAIVSLLLCVSSTAYSFQLLTDDKNGGNPKLDNKTYKIYIQNDPTGNNRENEIKEAIDKWKTVLGTQGVTLEVQTGNPPDTPLDLDKLNQEIDKFNKDPNPDMSKYPELQKSENKRCTISFYFATTADIINRRGGGSKRGFASNSWDLDDKGKANKVQSSDIFIASDPPGAAEEIKKIITHNIAIHELGHTAGLDHYTPEQDKTGSVMETDATLHGVKLELGDEETKGLKSIYGQTGKLNIESNAESIQTASLPASIKDHIPAGLENVWLYNYGLTWLEGEPVSYFQVETGDAPVFFAAGSAGLEDWLYQIPSNGQNYLKFFADQNYLGAATDTGNLQFYSSTAPKEGWLAYSGGSERGTTAIPEPATFLLGFLAALGVLARKLKILVFKG